MTEQHDLPDGDADLVMLGRVRAALRHVDDQDASVADAARAVALSHLSGSDHAGARSRHRSRWLAAVAAGVVGVVGAGVLLRTSPSEFDQQWTTEADASSFQVRSAELAVPEPLDPAALRVVVAANEPTDATCPLSPGQRSHGVHLVGGFLVEVITEMETGMIRALDSRSCDEMQSTVLDD